MRPLLCHEEKLVHLMLERHPECNCVMPRHVNTVVMPRGAGTGHQFVVNKSFTNYFREDEAQQDLALIDCQLCVPDTIGNELFLVQDRRTNQLAFMEFVGESACSLIELRHYIRDIAKILRTIGLSEDAEELLNGVISQTERSAASGNLANRGPHRHIRLLKLGACVCFYIGSGDSMLLHQPECVTVHECENGTIHQIRLAGENAIEGWVNEYSIRAPG